MPSRWPVITVAEVCDQIIDCVNKTAPTVTQPTPYKMIRTTNVRGGWVDTQNVKYVDEKVYRMWTRRGEPRRGDVILTREAPLGEVGLLRSSEPILLGQRLVMYRADPAQLDNRFLLYSMMEDFVQNQIAALGSGATVEHMRVPDCERLRLRLPPLQTQQRIASVLSGYDDLIEINRRRIRILDDLAEAIYNEWFVKLRFPGHGGIPLIDSNLGLLPLGWKVRQLRDVVELAYGKALKADDRRTGSVPVYGSGGIVGWHDTALVAGPGIVVGRKGNVGSVYWSDDPFFPIDTTYYVRTSLPMTFVYFALRGLQFINSHAAVPGLSRDQAYGLPLVVPNSEVSGKFDQAISPIFELRRTLLSAVENLQTTRDLLLPLLVSGEIDVSELDIELGDAAA